MFHKYFNLLSNNLFNKRFRIFNQLLNYKILGLTETFKQRLKDKYRKVYKWALLSKKDGR